MAYTPYCSPYARLVANVTESAGCWIGNDPRCRFGYQRLNFYVPGLAKAVKLTAHIATWLLVEAEAEGAGIVTADELYLAYAEFRASGLELDHTCVEPSCRNPIHLEPVTHTENMQRMRDRWAACRADSGVEHVEYDPSEVEF
jgi:hypothetical protein